MLSSTTQPGIVTLLSSTGSDPLQLFSTHIDSNLNSDSFICILNDATSLPLPPSPAILIDAPPLRILYDDQEGITSNLANTGHYALDQNVLHIQSPTLRTTYVCAPPHTDAPDLIGGVHTRNLGLQHPWLHMQVRDMGREWSFEVGLVDRAGREGVVRCSTFQV